MNCSICGADSDFGPDQLRKKPHHAKVCRSCVRESQKQARRERKESGPFHLYSLSLGGVLQYVGFTCDPSARRRSHRSRSRRFDSFQILSSMAEKGVALATEKALIAALSPPLNVRGRAPTLAK